MLVIFLVPYYLFNGLPPNTPTANILEMFKALAEVGGALVGFAGIVGIFALDAIRSAIGDNNNAAANLRIKGKDVGMVFVDNELMALRNRNRDLGRYMQSSLKDLFLTFVVFILEITFAVLGISGESPNWRGLLTACFGFLFMGTYVLYTLARRATTVAD